MNQQFKFTVALCAVVFAINTASAVTITLDKNGYADLAGGQISGTGLGSPVPLGTGTNSVSFTGVANGVYNVDWFHNSGTYGSDFFIYVNGAGTGVSSNSLSGHGGGSQVMSTGFTSGDTTVKLNTQYVNYNPHGNQTGVYYLYGATGAFSMGQGTNGPFHKAMIPGYQAVDNLYNTGLNNEDYQFLVRDNGTLAVVPGYEEYASFFNSDVNPRTHRMHVRVESSTNILCCIGIGYIHPLYNFQSLGLINGRYVYEFDESVAVGNDGHYFADYGSNTITGGVVMVPTNYYPITTAGVGRIGETRANDYLFNPRVRWDSVNDTLYFQNTDGNRNFTFETVSGYFDNQTTPLNMTIYAWIPEPTSLTLVALAGLAWIVRRRTG